MTIYGLPPRDKRGYHDLASAGHIILTPTQPVGARTVLGCVSNPRPLGHGAKPLPTELSRPRDGNRAKIRADTLDRNQVQTWHFGRRETWTETEPKKIQLQ
ncbi:hypothetical protein ElyMa_004047800 [Elysia marginata]|uniref:Uncharacterized protein n=1 Tax=Elysia marginata TaxID=1093978 RepID=A0AAV4G691_9GAST|nr:hypothetical protein ElyMa_004047800 [Elysia marginata]